MAGELNDLIVEVVSKVPGYKVIGGMAMVYGMKDRPWDARVTKDVDVDVLEDADEANEKLIAELEAAGLVVERFTINSGNTRLIVHRGTERVKVDISKASNSDFTNRIKTLDESFKDKFAIIMSRPDRRFKDVVDCIICLHSLFPQGISKKHLMECVGDEVRPIDFDVMKGLSDKFVPQVLNNLTMQEYAAWFYNLVCGLISDTLPDDRIYKDGEWY